MAREAFQDELDALRDDVAGMGEHVLGQLDDALLALETDDADLAREVIDGDAAVNERYLDLEARCVDLFALQQPVASDLRFVAAAFKILTDLERIGDLATNLGQYALAAEADGTPLLAAGTDETSRSGTDAADASVDDVDLPDDGGNSAADVPGDDGDSAAVTENAANGSAIAVPPERVTEIGRDAAAMVADALDAFVAGDADACIEIAQRDDELDVLCQRAGEDVVRGLVATGADSNETSGPNGIPGQNGISGASGADGSPTGWDVEAALDDVSRVLLTIRDLERVGDHAVNVAARTYYMIEHDPTLIV